MTTHPPLKSNLAAILEGEKLVVADRSIRELIFFVFRQTLSIGETGPLNLHKLDSGIQIIIDKLGYVWEQIKSNTTYNADNTQGKKWPGHLLTVQK